MEESKGESSGGFFRSSVLYPDCHTWLVFVSALDLMFTCLIIHLGGYEANAIAAQVIENFGLPGITIFKFGLVTIVIMIAEFVGRRRKGLGRQLATYSVAFPTTGAVVGAILLLKLGQQ